MFIVISPVELQEEELPFLEKLGTTWEIFYLIDQAVVSFWPSDTNFSNQISWGES